MLKDTHTAGKVLLILYVSIGTDAVPVQTGSQVVLLWLGMTWKPQVYLKYWSWWIVGNYSPSMWGAHFWGLR